MTRGYRDGQKKAYPRINPGIGQKAESLRLEGAKPCLKIRRVLLSGFECAAHVRLDASQLVEDLFAGRTLNIRRSGTVRTVAVSAAVGNVEFIAGGGIALKRHARAVNAGFARVARDTLAGIVFDALTLDA